MIKLFSFFSGAGLLDLAFEDEGYHIVYVNEYHVPFLEAYKYARVCMNIDCPEYGYHDGSIVDLFKAGNYYRLSDLTNDARRTGALVGFIGGPPCPDFSVGGKNRGREGENGRLSETYIELILRLKPDIFLFENVKGLLKTKRHRIFYDELKTRALHSGYVIAETLANAIEYGTPQDRERIFLFGTKREVAGEYQLESSSEGIICRDSFPWDKYAKYPGRSAFNYNWPRTSAFAVDSELPQPLGIPVELTVEYWFQRNNVFNHPNSVHCFRPKAGMARFLTVDEGDDSRKSFKRLHRWRYSPTAAYGNNEVHLHPYKARRLSVAEVMAIQSLPREFELPADMTLTNMFKAIGNGVPFMLSKAVARLIKEVLQL
jgi:DNA (cytosine-5)-methyltransferase 1